MGEGEEGEEAVRQSSPFRSPFLSCSSLLGTDKAQHFQATVNFPLKPKGPVRREECSGGQKGTSGKPCTVAMVTGKASSSCLRADSSPSLRTPPLTRETRQPLQFQHRPRGWTRTRWLKECG